MTNPRWFKKWGGEYGKRVSLYVLNDLMSMCNESFLYNSYDADKTSIIIRMARLNMLNPAQIAALTNTSRQHVHNSIKAAGVDMPTNTVRGKISPLGLTYCREIVTRLHGNDLPSSDLYVETMSWTDKSLISHLTGVPMHILNEAGKR